MKKVPGNAEIRLRIDPQTAELLEMLKEHDGLATLWRLGKVVDEWGKDLLRQRPDLSAELQLRLRRQGGNR